MTNLVLPLVAQVTQQSRRAFIQQTRRIEEVQDRWLRSLLQSHQNTVLGQEYHLSDIRTIDQFRERVPILPYSSYEPYIERVAKGEPNVLTSDPVTYLNMTSGTTGKQKLIPATWRSRRMLSRANQAGMGFAMNVARQRRLPLGKMLLTSSANLLGYTSGGIPYGPVSVGHLRSTNPLYQQVVSHPFEALKISDSLARHYVCLLFALQNVHLGMIGANFPVLALRLCQYLEEHAEALIEDVATGAIAPWLNLDDALRAQLEPQCRPMPHRAAELRHLLKTHGTLTPQLAWPHLAFLVTARGGTSDFYFERFPEYFGNVPIFGGTYASAEGTFGVHFNFNTDSTILAIASGFFEFIPVDQWEESQPKTVLPWEVKAGEFYRLAVTNYSGFYRYDIGDVVEVEGFFEQTPLITFRYRRGGLLSSMTEKTTEFHAIQTMQQLQQEFGVALENFCITLSEDVLPPRYLVNLELSPGHDLPHPERFLERFDAVLKEVHRSYEVKRRDQVPPPQLNILAPGSFAILRQRLLQRGVPESQLKFTHITDDRQWLAGLTIQRVVPFPDVSNVS
jgi:hypothetical protein